MEAELKRMELRSTIVDAINIISEQVETIKDRANEQYKQDLGGKVYKRNGVSQFHALADIAREAGLIDFACNAMAAQIALLDKLYANEPIIAAADIAEAKRVSGQEDIF